MAGTSQNKQAHSRSISLPARLHPNSLKIEEELNKIKICRQSSSSALTAIPSNADSIRTGLIKLAELYDNIDAHIHSPSTQQALHNQQHKNLFEEALQSSAELLNACGNARDLMLNMKERVQDLQSALRRRGGDPTSMYSNVHAYVSFRKKLKKDIAKCLRALKKAETHIESCKMVDVNDPHVSIVINVLRESSSITIFIFRSILLFLSTQEMKTKAGGWSLIRKLTPVAAQKLGPEILNEVGNVDLAVNSLHGQIRKSDAKAVDVQMALGRLETLDFCINALETGSDCLFRRLVQNRVSLLNVLTRHLQ